MDFFQSFSQWNLARSPNTSAGVSGNSTTTMQRLHYREFVSELEPDPIVPVKPEPYKPGELCDNEFCFQQIYGPHAHVASKEGK